ncbi:MAG: AAA family ATPase [Acidimicrobiales bacterium]
MLLSRLYLRNFRVFEDELDLALPPGLVGIFGPNGAGKSALLESILWTLWGRARTAKEEIRSAGVGGECVTEVSFEHEGHLYLARRSLSGAAAAVRAEAHCDGLMMSEGVRDTARYLHSVLGMDDGAFRASVFAEQKQLAAFSDQSPADRRRLVLQLLGVTPLDQARDAARRDARSAVESHRRLRGILPDLDSLEVAVADADARAAAAGQEAAVEEQAVVVARSGAERAAEAFRRLDRLRQAWEALVSDGRAARADLDAAVEAAAALEAELASLAAAAAELATLEPRSAGLAGAEGRLAAADSVLAASVALARTEPGPEPADPDPGPQRGAAAAAEAARLQLAHLAGVRRAAEADLERARQQAARSAALTGTASCPLCGQGLGQAFEQVQAHRAAELTDASARLEVVSGRWAGAEALAAGALAELSAAQAALDTARSVRAAWEQAAARRDQAAAALGAAVDALAGLDARLSLQTAAAGGAAAVAAGLRAEVEAMRQAAATAQRLRGRLERRPAATADWERAGQRAAGAEGRVAALRDKVSDLRFDKGALDEAEAAAVRAAAVSDGSERQAQALRVRAATARSEAEGEARRLATARHQHAELGQLETEARHLGRLAELINAFRNTVVASVGPRLAVQAAELFGELTDNEYDRLEVDPETFALQVSDAGRKYGLARFSGSEVDLANLAMRVAISEHVRFQSGGSVGLLVLDEVFGPLDEDRRGRMLQALERLRGRFRQILVVTHASEIKEQLPGAIEVVKRPGRRATARVVNG